MLRFRSEPGRQAFPPLEMSIQRPTPTHRRREAGSRLRTVGMRLIAGVGGALCGVDAVQVEAMRPQPQVDAGRPRLQGRPAGAADQVQRPVAGLAPRIGVRASSQQHAQSVRASDCRQRGAPRSARAAHRRPVPASGRCLHDVCDQASRDLHRRCAGSGEQAARASLLACGRAARQQASPSRAHAASPRLHQAPLFSAALCGRTAHGRPRGDRQ